MKMTKKKIFAISLIVCAIAILSMGTLAWFTDNDTVKNEFMVADSTETDPEKVFSVNVYEKEDTDGDGSADKLTESGIVFDGQDVTPGANLVKEIYVDNTGKFDQYVRVIVTLSDISAWMDVMGITTTSDYVNLAEIFLVENDFDTTWHRNDDETIYDSTKDTLTYVYYYNGVLKPDSDVITFMKGVKIPTALEKEDVIVMKGGFTLDVVAEAVQSVNMLDTYGAIEYQNAIDSFEIIKA
jgi:predicted ribosomally synthesized peptide with SipW-like signal peptide